MHQYHARVLLLLPVCPPFLLSPRPALPLSCASVRRGAAYAAPKGEAGPCIIQEAHVILNDNRIDSQQFDFMQMATGVLLAQFLFAVLFYGFLKIGMQRL